MIYYHTINLVLFKQFLISSCIKFGLFIAINVCIILSPMPVWEKNPFKMLFLKYLGNFRLLFMKTAALDDYMCIFDENFLFFALDFTYTWSCTYLLYVFICLHFFSFLTSPVVNLMYFLRYICDRYVLLVIFILILFLHYYICWNFLGFVYFSTSFQNLLYLTMLSGSSRL